MDFIEQEANHEEIIKADKQAFLGNDKFIKEMYNKIVEKIDGELVENLVAWPLFLAQKCRKKWRKSRTKNGLFLGISPFELPASEYTWILANRKSFVDMGQYEIG